MSSENKYTEFESCLLKQNALLHEFVHFTNSEQKYVKIIDLGRSLELLDPSLRLEEKLVKGCQSQLFLHSSISKGKIYFSAFSDALISAGLAAMMLRVYSGESPETILKCPPNFLDQLNIHGSLTPNRSNGLSSLHLRMKQDALAFLLPNKSLFLAPTLAGAS